MFRSARWFAFLVPLALAGCGAAAQYPVTGKVTVGGQPATGAIVVLTPAADPGSMAKKPSGTVKADGTFALNTQTDTDGVAAGEYLVSVTWPGKPKSPAGSPKGMGGEDERAPSAGDQFGGRYSDPKASGLKAAVNAGPTELKPFELK